MAQMHQSPASAGKQPTCKSAALYGGMQVTRIPAVMVLELFDVDLADLSISRIEPIPLAEKRLEPTRTVLTPEAQARCGVSVASPADRGHFSGQPGRSTSGE